MADTTRDMIYRSFKVNDASIDPGQLTGHAGAGIYGSVVDSFDLSDVDVAQFREKRALQDGMDAGDVFLGARRLRLAGTLYGRTRAELFDLWDDFLAATNPVLAQRESPADKGYLPFYYSKPTNRVEYDNDIDQGMIDLRVLVLPWSRQVIAQRDNLGGSDRDALAVPWQAVFIAKDPTIYSTLTVDVDLSTGSTGEQTWLNRGNYIAAMNMLLVVGPEAGSVAVAAGGAAVTITVPASSGNRIIRYKGKDSGGPTLEVEENSVNLTRFDLLNLGTAQSHPIIPPGSSTYQVTFTGVTPQAGSHMWFWEAYS